MFLAAAESPPAAQQPWWLVVAGLVGTILVAYLAARGPVWVEKVRNLRKPDPPADPAASAEDVLRAWLESALRERDKALKDVARLNKQVDALERELYRRGWDGQINER